ncbi:MAG: LLM class flavin-dependent oxidoreductase [Microbacterium sp.]|jgi:alkanesulfonate monooxygenase SsuD/methylene tetrahydromethanopterin reductase-like flavin-dependent oxidoreductase (luciferase family)|uniref:LLM class flavin-dependent oxidoreductase n=1 Tax=Microbacterium sp. TaxID=51671 RepID=UPI001ACF9AC3|nr:LLM class flavin-dependent oxidoreductase [Microbacterium sp.]MBN9155547.1 LLM class flavin-dependent oxidoreductase [Microbacterium sp.]
MADLEVGVGIWSLQSTKAGPRHFSYLYKELMEDAAFCDQFPTIKTIWQTEHHFWYDGYCPSLLTVAGGIAAATKRIRIGQAALLFSQHEALRVAQQAAVVDQLSGGRLDLGLALGYRDNEFDGFNIDRRSRRRRFEEGIQVVKSAFGQGGVDFQGREFSVPDVEVTPKPYQADVPIWVAAVGADPIKRAAKLGASIILSDALTLEQMRHHIDLYYTSAEELGVDVSKAKIGVLRRGWVAETDDEAYREALPSLRFLLREQLGGWRYLVDEQGEPVGFDRPKELDAAAHRLVSVHERTIGRPEKVVRGLREIAATGATHVIFGTRFDSLPRQKYLRSLELLATEVIPNI